MTFKYLPEKAQQAILYIADALPEKENMYKVLKVIYFADKKHLYSFGRFIYGESYAAMQHGPVPSKAYDMVKNVRFTHATHPETKDDGALFTVTSDNTIVPIVKPDISAFSKSDLECLNTTIEELRNLTFRQVRALSHDEAYDKAGANDFMTIESIAEMAPNKDDLLEHLSARH